MKSINKFFLYLLLNQFVWIFSSCYKEPYKIDYETIDGYVIGRETCNVDESKDYWLVDFTLTPGTPQVGDTVELNGVIFNNVLKVKGIDERLKYIGMKVTFDYRTITSSRIRTTGCTHVRPVTYDLKELLFIKQGELR